MKTDQPSQQEVEFRLCQDLELRQTDGDGLPEITGYAAVFDVVADIGGGRLERIRRGAFTESLASGENLYALVQHKTDKVLGRRGAGTLDVREDRKGLFVAIKPPNTVLGRDTVEDIRAGNIDGMSVGMNVQDAPFAIEEGRLVRSVERAKLRDVSVATFAAYPGTTIMLRSLAVFDEQAALVGVGLPVELAKQKLDILELTAP